MSLSDITDANAIRSAIAEFDVLGRDPFLQKYGFGRARQYFLRTDQGNLYDSKAILERPTTYSFLSAVQCELRTSQEGNRP